MLLGGSTLAPAASAADREPVRVEVRADCTDDAAFFDAVAARTPHVRKAEPAEAPAHTLRVHIETAPHDARGELVIVDARGVTTRRELAAESCDVVVSGLAWVAARAIDPDASSTPTLQCPTSPPQPPRPPLIPCPAAPAPLCPAPAPAPEPLGLDPARNHAPARSPEPAPARWRFAAGVEAYAFGAATSVPVADIGVFAELARDTPATLAPAFRLSVHHTSEADVTVPQTTGAFTWTFARAEACPWRFDLGVAFELRACALVDGGVLAASGGAGAGFQAASHLRPWLTAGELARLEWALLGPVLLEVEGGLALPLVRESFTFDTAATVYEPPAVVGFGSLGLGVRFR